MDLDHEANVPQFGLEDPVGRLGAAKQKLGQLGRTLKRIEIRESIVEHPFRAIGIAAGVGAIIGLARPMPERSRVGSLVMASLSAIGIRVLRQVAMEHLGAMARDWLAAQQGADPAPGPKFSPAYGDR